MKVTKYEIDMLNVKAADAFLIHFFNDDNNCEYVVLIDGGNYEDGKTIAEFIRTNYTQHYIDLAICTHCDKDHYGGLIYLLEQQRDDGDDNMGIQEIWVDDPANHVELGKIKWYRRLDTLEVEARSVFDLGDTNLMNIIDGLVEEKKIKFFEPFADTNDYHDKSYISSKWSGLITIIGPTVDYYSELVPDFRNDLKKKDYETDENEDSSVELTEGQVYSKTLKDAGDDPSTHNQSSVILKFVPDNGDVYLFLGDAGREAIESMSQDDIDSIQNVYWLKVPHHGSKYNIDNDIINHIHPEVAYISTEKYGHYLSKAVVNALKKAGADVYSTSVNGSMCHHHNTITHAGYSTANPL